MADKLSFYERTGFHGFDEIYQTYHGKIKRYVQKRVQNNSDVEDIVQQTFLALLERGDNLVLQRKNAMGSYLYTAAKNRTIDYFRKRTSREKEKQSKEESTVSQFSRGETTCVGEEERLVQKIKAILPEKCWQVFLPHVFGGYSYREIGEKLGLNIITVEQRQLRARKKLQYVWDEWNARDDVKI